MRIHKAIILFLALGLSITTKVAAQNNDSYEIVYEADKDGKAISGSVGELTKYVQNGNPIRVGWVLRFKDQQGKIVEMQHWTDAGFVTTLKGHVFAQIKSIYQQGPVMTEPPGVFLVSDKANGWVAIIGTTGVMKQKYTRDEAMVQMLKDSGMTDEQVERELKKMETMKVQTKWAVQKRSKG